MVINSDIAIIVVGYNRIHSITRLLKSILSADYLGDKVDLIVSIDKGENQGQIIKAAEEVNWIHGVKRIIVREEKMGLRNHIFSCGNISSEYEAIVMLEDDLVVSPYYYAYTKCALGFYKEEPSIVGLSLYKMTNNQYAGRCFEPDNDNYDVFFMQIAQSWGQCWSKRMWKDFIDWFNKSEKTITNDGLIPCSIVNWQNSWLKYFMRYTVEGNKFFVYPRTSLTTNYSDPGTHSTKGTTDYMVSLQVNPIKYKFASFDDGIKYDSFFERIDLETKIAVPGKVCMDLYGSKSRFDGYDILVSTAPHPYKIIESYSLKLRPHELNCIFKESGEDIFVYDLNNSSFPPKIKKDNLLLYDYRLISLRKSFSLFRLLALNYIKRRFKRL